MPLVRGDRLGPYEVTAPIGAGGMGEVYRARDSRLGRDVAIKLLPAAAAADPDRLQRFSVEARAVGRLSDPNIVAIYDVGRVPDGLAGAGSPYLVLELLDGRTLREEIDGRPLPPARAVEYAAHIARALSAAHGQGIIHRDLKPENLFVTKDGRIKVLDFGLAKLTDVAPVGATDTVTGTQPGVVMGTAAYMSPEQVRGEPADQRSDIFALGTILHEMLTGRPLFARPASADTMTAILRDDPAPIAAADASVPPALDRIVRHCLEKTPDHRFQTARDLAFGLETLSGMAAPAPARQVVPRARRLGWLGAIAAITVAGVAGWIVWRPAPSKPTLSNVGGGAAAAAPFLASDAIERDPAWSPTGNLIAYVSDRAGNDDVWICDPSGASPINLTAGFTGVEAMPAWSPDGQRIAFFSDRDEGGIFSMTVLGGDVRRIAPVKPGILYTFSLDWGRDGSIVFTNFDDRDLKQIYRTGSAGGDVTCLTCAIEGTGAQSGALSPSGRLLAFTGPEIRPRARLSVLDLSTGQLQVLADRSAKPRWSADGVRVLFISADEGTPDLWEVAVDPETGARTGTPQRVTSGLNAVAAVLSPDGRRALVVKESTRSRIWSFPTAVDRVVTLDVGTELSSGEFVDARARWMPDGRTFVFQSNRRGSTDIWSAAPGSPDPARLTSGAAVEERPRPSPDGRWIAFDAAMAHGEFVHLMRPDGSAAHVLDDGWPERFRSVCCSNWSPDGTRLAVSLSNEDNKVQNAIGIVTVDAGRGTAIKMEMLKVRGGEPQYARWSPDGRMLVYEAVAEGSWDLWTVTAAGGVARRITMLPGNERQAVWHPDGRSIYFHYNAGEVWRAPMNADGSPAGAPQPWLQIPRYPVFNDGLDMNPAGDRVLLALRSPASDIWLVERTR